MPIRDKFPKEYFQGNPLKGATPDEAYKRLQWGNNPRERFTIEGPEPMAVLGELAKVFFVGKGRQTFREGEYFLAVGTRSNTVYFVPMDERGRPFDFPRGFMGRLQQVSRVRRTDYYSEKGGESGYYFHDHEAPFPVLCRVGSHYCLIPARHNGGRSYAVNDEGIIG